MLTSIFLNKGVVAQKPLFISEEGKKIYNNAYDSLLKKYHIEYNDIWVDTYLGKAHLIETGKKNGQPVLMMHAAGLSAAEWYANYNALGKTYHLFGLDMPGDAGKSEPYKNPDKIEDYQLSILQILDSLQIEKVIILGHSIGGFFSAGFAIAHPERVEKLILLSPATTHVPFHWYFKLLLKIEAKPGKGPTAAKRLKAVAHKGFIHESAFVILMETVRDFADVNMLFPYVYSKKELASIQVPTTLIIGNKEKICNYKKSISKAKKRIPGVTIHVIENAVHVPNMEYPEKINELLLTEFDKS